MFSELETLRSHMPPPIPRAWCLASLWWRSRICSLSKPLKWLWWGVLLATLWEHLKGRGAKRGHFHLLGCKTQVHIFKRPRIFLLFLYLFEWKANWDGKAHIWKKEKNHTENLHYLINVQNIDMGEITLIINMCCVLPQVQEREIINFRVS